MNDEARRGGGVIPIKRRELQSNKTDTKKEELVKKG